MESFSLRKLAKKVGVSPAACYNHYPSIESLVSEMKKYVSKKFCDALIVGAKCTDPRYVAISLGKAYLNEQALFNLVTKYNQILYGG